MSESTIMISPDVQQVGVRFDFSAIRAQWRARLVSKTAVREFGKGDTADEFTPEIALFPAKYLLGGPKTLSWYIDCWSPEGEPIDVSVSVTLINGDWTVIRKLSSESFTMKPRTYRPVVGAVMVAAGGES